jgi:hypothetical protein
MQAASGFLSPAASYHNSPTPSHSVTPVLNFSSSLQHPSYSQEPPRHTALASTQLSSQASAPVSRSQDHIPLRPQQLLPRGASTPVMQQSPQPQQQAPPQGSLPSAPYLQYQPQSLQQDGPSPRSATRTASSATVNNSGAHRSSNNAWPPSSVAEEKDFNMAEEEVYWLDALFHYCPCNMLLSCMFRSLKGSCKSCPTWKATCGRRCTTSSPHLPSPAWAAATTAGTEPQQTQVEVEGRRSTETREMDIISPNIILIINQPKC